jgi:mono/diheme cytochrome c family protein
LSTTLSMWMGISFLVIGLLATILQSWLWSFPMVPDPGGPDPNGKSTAPRAWTNVHRVLGLLFVVIYVVMMVQMTPRLWNYQVELPARTIMHAVMGITIGFLLVMKIAIIRWWQHFGKALPKIGAAIMLCTIILSFLSIPYAMRAQDFGTAATPESLERVSRLLEGVDLGVPVAAVATPEAMAEGREILTGKCVVCHDLRTILRRPYTPEGWRDVVWRMAEKPQIERPMKHEDLAPVTAYLVAITPDIQQSVRMKREAELEAKGGEESEEEEVEPVAAAEPVAAVDGAVGADVVNAGHEADAAVAEVIDGRTSEPPEVVPAADGGTVADAGPVDASGDVGAAAPVAAKPAEKPPAPPVKKKGIDLDAPGMMARAKAVYTRVCSSCHGLEDTESHPRQTEAGWRALVKRMNTDNDAGIKPGEVALISAYLGRVYGKGK